MKKSLVAVLMLIVFAGCHKADAKFVPAGFWPSTSECLLLRHKDASLSINLSGHYSGKQSPFIRVERTVFPLTLDGRKFNQSINVTPEQLGHSSWCNIHLSPGVQLESWHVQESKSYPNTIVLGLDGATWRILRKLMQQNRVPHFQQLIGNGSSGILESVEDSKSPVIWTTIATGKSADQHGVKNFVDRSGHPVHSGQILTKRIWDMTTDNSELTSGVMGWYVTWPVQKVSGFMISDRAFQGLDDQSYYPAALEQPFEQVRQDRGSKYQDECKRFTSFPFDPDFKDMKPSPIKKKNELLFKRLFHVYYRDSVYLESGLKFYEMFHPDVFYVYVRGNDYTQHVYWQYMAPQETFKKPSKKDREYFGKIIENYYVFLDEEIGKYMKLAGNNTTFIVVSDHGFQGIKEETKGDLSGGHEPAGIYIVSGPGFRKNFHYDGISIFDVCPLLLYQLGLPVAKDMPGNVPLEVRSTPEPNPSFIASYGAPSNTAPQPLPSKVDDEIKEQLRTLGYIN